MSFLIINPAASATSKLKLIAVAYCGTVWWINGTYSSKLCSQKKPVHINQTLIWQTWSMCKEFGIFLHFYKLEGPPHLSDYHNGSNIRFYCNNNDTRPLKAKLLMILLASTVEGMKQHMLLKIGHHKTVPYFLGLGQVWTTDSPFSTSSIFTAESCSNSNCMLSRW